jgi:hypothetical protein
MVYEMPLTDSDIAALSGEVTTLVAIKYADLASSYKKNSC